MALPSATPEVWAAIKIASIRGVPDQKLAEYFDVTVNAITSRRFDDPEWKAAKKGQPANRSYMIPSQLATVAKQIEGVTEASLQEIGEKSNVLLARYADQKINTAVANDMLPDIQDWSQMKIVNEMLRKATGQDKDAPAVTLNLFGGGDSGFEEAPVLDGFCESVQEAETGSIETQEADETDFC